MSMKEIVLTSSDGVSFEIDEAVALKSQTIADLLKNNDVNNGIHIPDVTGEILAKVIEYCKKHVVIDGDSSSSSKEELKNWDAEFTNIIDQSMLFDLIMAADFLKIESLLDLTFQRVAADQTPDPIHNIENDFTPKEDAKVREESPWAFA